MLDILKSYLAKEKYFLIIMDNGIYIKNYDKLLGIKSDEVTIEIDHKIYQIKGSSFSVKRSLSREIKISGLIESVKTI